MDLVSVQSLLEAKSKLRPRKPRGGTRSSDPKPPKPPEDAKDSDNDTVSDRQRNQQQQAKKTAQTTDAKKAASLAKRRKTIQKKRKAAMKDAAADNKRKRQDRRQRSQKRKQGASGTRGGTKKEPADHVPAQIAHCMLALNKKRGKSTRAAWNICRWAMTKHGYLKGPYRVNTKLPKATKQTSKGTRRSFQHGMEKGPLNKGISGTGTTKYRKFKQMFRGIEKDVVPKGGL